MHVRKLFPGQYKIVSLFDICGLEGELGLFKSSLDVRNSSTVMPNVMTL